MSDGDALLRAVIEAPDEDAPRLVYADWLEEQGGEENIERAEFIRLQIERSQLGAEAPKASAKREQALLRKYAKRWAKPLRALICEWEYRRGFVEKARMITERNRGQFASMMERTTAFTPLRILYLSDQFLDAHALLAAAPHMSRIREIEFHNGHFHREGPVVCDFLASPHLSGLSRLYLFGNSTGSWFGNEGLSSIVKLPTLANLRHLTLIGPIGGGLHSSVIRAIAGSPSMSNLTRLDLEVAAIEPSAMKALGRSPRLAQLEILNLSHAAMGVAAWEELLRSPGFRRLRRLILAHIWVRRQAVRQRLLDEDLQNEAIARFGAGVVDFNGEDVRPWRSHHWY